MLTLREMQILAEAQYSVEQTREDLGRMVQFFLGMPEQEEFLNIAFVKERKLPMELAKEQKVFFINEDFPAERLPEEFRAESLGMVKGKHVVFAGRLVYPVMDVKGAVMGFCGWDKFVQPKYLDSKNHGYKAKNTTLYGMELLPGYYRSKEPVYVVEGIVCCLYLRSIGLQSLALLGSRISPYVAQILRRFGGRLIVVPDNDAVGKQASEIGYSLAGEHFVRQAKRMLPKAHIVQSAVAKDIDDTRQVPGCELALSKELKAVWENPFVKCQVLRIRK